jgi:uncharacterized protein YdaU (DUF1376 family)
MSRETKASEATIWFPYHIRDFRSEQYTLNFEQRGMYIALIERLWECGGELPSSDGSLAAELGIKPREWAKHKAVILARFLIAEGRISHVRMTAELGKARSNVEQRRLAGIASANARKANGTATGVATEAQRPLNENANETATGEQRGGNPARVEGARSYPGKEVTSQGSTDTRGPFSVRGTA